jgi:hypothetical protein
MPGVRKTVRLFHSRPDEAQPLIRLLEDAGFIINYKPLDSRAWSELRTLNPVAVVIDLTRLPSQGRYIALKIRATKALQHLPIVFVDGDPAKVDLIRRDFPDAIFTPRARLVSEVRRAKPLAKPVSVRNVLVSYETRTVSQKLGIAEGMRVSVIDPPRAFERLLAGLPEDIEFVEDESAPLTLWFVRDPDTYLAGLRSMRTRKRLWIVYSKGGKSALTQTVVRSAALDVGLVDYKICSVSDTWTAMLFTMKKG